ncbi:MAG: glutamate--cysteine ligase [Rhodospirillales bacterium]|nr:glutamate--cysteine ligase [Rhodospirillales bacterium]
MSAPSTSAAASPAVTDKRQLLEYMASGCKPPANWRIGTEHEKFAYRLSDLRPLDYEGEQGVGMMLDKLTRFGWKPVAENGKVIALIQDDGSSITLEPAGQLELSGAPLGTIHETCKEVGIHLQQVKAVAAEMGIGFLGLGYQPKWPRESMPWMPKGRYEIMKSYMPKRGKLGLHMMQSTCTVQVNLDFDSEATMVKMFRVSLALQPIATALFANSPFKEGKPSGYLSYRSHIWTDTDPDRCGNIPFVFEDGFGFERYVDYMLDVPMYFVYRNGRYIDASGQSFRDFMAGKLPAYPGEYPTLKDWEDHLTTAFPEVRLKKFLEMRGADGGPWGRLCALPALWVGLLYDATALDAAWELIKDWSHEEHDHLRAQVPTQALNTPFRKGTVSDVALDMLEIAHEGLVKRQRLDGVGLDESRFLKPLFQIAESDLTPAEELLLAFERRWKGNIDPIFTEYAY